VKTRENMPENPRVCNQLCPFYREYREIPGISAFCVLESPVKDVNDPGFRVVQAQAIYDVDGFCRNGLSEAQTRSPNLAANLESAEFQNATNRLLENRPLFRRHHPQTFVPEGFS